MGDEGVVVFTHINVRHKAIDVLVRELHWRVTRKHRLIALYNFPGPPNGQC